VGVCTTCSEITLLNQIKATPCEGAAAYLIDHLSIHFLLKLHPKMFKHSGQQEPIREIMRISGVCNTSNMFDHEGRKVYLLASVHEISETLIYGISLVMPLPSRDDVLNEEPEHELVE